MKDTHPVAQRKFGTLPAGHAAVSAITVCELRFGVENSKRPVENKAVLDRILMDLEIHPFGEAAAPYFARLRATLKRVGKPIGPMDTLIAAHALQLGACLVTNNTREFSRVPGLKTENWIA